MDPQTEPAVYGIVLAAGESRRMGQPKALLELDGQTFIERAIRTLRDGGCRAVVAVVRKDDDWIARLADVAGAMVALNDDPASEQIDSLRLGVADLPEDAVAAVVLPVDLPAVRPESVRAVIEAFRARGAPLVRPTHGDRPGHPGLLARSVFAELDRDDLPHGVHSLIEAHAGEVEEVEVDDAGVLADVNTPDDLERIAEQP